MNLNISKAEQNTTSLSQVLDSLCECPQAGEACMCVCVPLPHHVSAWPSYQYVQCCCATTDSFMSRRSSLRTQFTFSWSSAEARSVTFSVDQWEGNEKEHRWSWLICLSCSHTACCLMLAGDQHQGAQRD